MILAGGAVVGFCGFDFVLEIADGEGCAVGRDFDGPSFFPAVPGDAFVFRGAGTDGSSGVTVVLGAGCEAEVGLSIVEAVIVYVVDDKPRGRVHYLAVHVDGGLPALSTDSGIAFGVEGVGVFGDMPFVFDEPFVIIRVNDGEFALS